MASRLDDYCMHPPFIRSSTTPVLAVHGNPDWLKKHHADADTQFGQLHHQNPSRSKIHEVAAGEAPFPVGYHWQISAGCSPDFDHFIQIGGDLAQVLRELEAPPELSIDRFDAHSVAYNGVHFSTDIRPAVPERRWAEPAYSGR